MESLKLFVGAVLAAMVLSAVPGAPAASATELYGETNANQTVVTGTEFVASLKTGTSLSVKDITGATHDTCTTAKLNGKVESSGAPTVTVALSSLVLGCTETTDVIKAGKLHIEAVPGTTGTVTWSGLELTVKSTILGTTCTVSTGTGQKVGTITSATSSSGLATFEMNAVIPMGACGEFTWTGTFTVTTPSGLLVEKREGSELFKDLPGVKESTLGIGNEIITSLKSGTSALKKTTAGEIFETCSTSGFEGTITEAGSATTHTRAKLWNFTMEGCAHPMTTIAPGTIKIEYLSGTTNGRLYSENFEASMYIAPLGVTCTAKTASGTNLGTITGAISSTGYATFDMNAVLSTGLCGDISLAGTYTVTSPTGLVVKAS
jgi:hypothetical protein